jgi:DNA-binding NtrC family response regulator
MSEIKVLLVDDEVDFTAGMKRVLSSRGFDVKEARNGLVALSLIGEQQFDVVVLDIKMPGMDGIHVLAEIKRLSPDVPVILLTGHYDLCDDEDAWKTRAYACVFKPCPIMKLVEVIAAAASGDGTGKKPSATGDDSPTYINTR